MPWALLAIIWPACDSLKQETGLTGALALELSCFFTTHATTTQWADEPAASWPQAIGDVGGA